MADFTKRHFSKVGGLDTSTSYLCSEHKDFRKLSHPKSEFLKCPMNIGDSLTRNSWKKDCKRKLWKDFNLYIKYLDMKVQNPDCGTYKNEIKKEERYYQRLAKQLIKKGWAYRKDKIVHLRAYQYVWRDLGITRVKDKKSGIQKFKYWKIPLHRFPSEKRYYKVIDTSNPIKKNGKPNYIVMGYLKEVEDYLRKKISERKRAQFRWALKEKDNTRATFSSRSAGSLFGYKSPSSGTKLRTKYFEVIPMTEEEAKPKWIKERGRYEEPTKQIAI